MSEKLRRVRLYLTLRTDYWWGARLGDPKRATVYPIHARARGGHPPLVWIRCDKCGSTVLHVATKHAKGHQPCGGRWRVADDLAPAWPRRLLLSLLG